MLGLGRELMAAGMELTAAVLLCSEADALEGPRLRSLNEKGPSSPAEAGPLGDVIGGPLSRLEVPHLSLCVLWDPRESHRISSPLLGPVSLSMDC